MLLFAKSFSENSNAKISNENFVENHLLKMVNYKLKQNTKVTNILNVTLVVSP